MKENRGERSLRPRERRAPVKMAVHAQYKSRDYSLNASHFSTLQYHLFHFVSWNDKRDERYCKFYDINENFTFLLQVMKIIWQFGHAKRRRRK